MPIDELIRESSFSPEEIRVIVEAFNGLCKELQITQRSDPIAQVAARALIAAARQGATDPKELLRRSLRGLRQ